jgi:hypothetical protein
MFILSQPTPAGHSVLACIAFDNGIASPRKTSEAESAPACHPSIQEFAAASATSSPKRRNNASDP